MVVLVVDEKELGNGKDREKGFHLALRRGVLDRVEGFVGGMIMLRAKEEEERQQGAEEVAIITTSKFPISSIDRVKKPFLVVVVFGGGGRRWRV